MHWEIKGLEKLSFRERQVVMLKESGRSGEEIAGRLNISVNSVSTLLNRAKTKGYLIVGIIEENEMGLRNYPLEDRPEDEEKETK